MSVWYYAKGNNQAGPVAPEQLHQLISSGALSASDRVWKDGMAAWAPIASVPELAGGAPAAAPEPLYAAPASAAPAYGAPEQLPYATPLGVSSGGVMATGRSLEMLRQTKPWVRFISIVILVGIGLGVAVTVIGVGMASGRAAEAAGVQLVVVIVFAVLGGISAWMLSQYASAIDRLLKSRNEADLEAALRAQKSYWVFSGVLMLIGIILYAILFLVILGGAALFR